MAISFILKGSKRYQRRNSKFLRALKVPSPGISSNYLRDILDTVYYENMGYSYQSNRPTLSLEKGGVLKPAARLLQPITYNTYKQSCQ